MLSLEEPALFQSNEVLTASQISQNIACDFVLHILKIQCETRRW
jgi:hypothetical protein